MPGAGEAQRSRGGQFMLLSGAAGKLSRKSPSSLVLKAEQEVAAHRPPGQRGGSQGQRERELVRLGM